MKIECTKPGQSWKKLVTVTFEEKVEENGIKKK